MTATPTCPHRKVRARSSSVSSHEVTVQVTATTAAIRTRLRVLRSIASPLVVPPNPVLPRIASSAKCPRVAHPFRRGCGPRGTAPNLFDRRLEAKQRIARRTTSASMGRSSGAATLSRQSRAAQLSREHAIIWTGCDWCSARRGEPPVEWRESRLLEHHHVPCEFGRCPPVHQEWLMSHRERFDGYTVPEILHDAARAFLIPVSEVPMSRDRIQGQQDE